MPRRKKKAYKRRPKRKKYIKIRKGRKVKVKQRFRNAIKQLHRMNPVKQRVKVVGASNAFIRDVSNFLKKIKRKAHLVQPSHRRVLKKHRKKLKKLVNPKTSIDMKRMILSQKGGIVPALIPIFVALIGAGGTVAASAASAAIMKNRS